MNTAAPADGWFLVCRQKVTADRVYNAGCRVEASALGRNLESLLRVGAVRWAAPGTPCTGNVQDLPIQAAPKEKPKVVIVDRHDSPILNWQQTLAAMTRRCDGDQAQALDLLMGVEPGRQLYKLATKIAVAEAKQQRKLHTINPNEVGF